MQRHAAADAVICGLTGTPDTHIRHGMDIIGLSPGHSAAGALRVLILDRGVFFMAHSVKPGPTAREMADIAREAARRVRWFGQTPKLAFLSHSNFGASEYESAPMMSAATALFQQEEPDIEAEGEMQADSALVEEVRARVLAPAQSRLSGRANLFIMPSRDAASIAFNLLKEIADGIGIGPMMLGLRRPLHILMPGVTTRGILNMAAIATVEAQDIDARPPSPPP
jgi:malate dehydrogenase (oxaloacetate-decarboxylating)(NADP+)